MASDKPSAFIFLQLLCKYLNIDMYLALNIHTTRTIEAGKDELAEYNDLLNVSGSLIYYNYSGYYLLYVGVYDCFTRT